MKQLSDLIDESYTIPDRAYAKYAPSLTVSLFSGGYDSVTVTHLASQWAEMHNYPFKVAHINTGTGIKETLEYVRSTCQLFNWELIKYNAREYIKSDGTPDPQIYEDMILEYGFPGPHMHSKMYNRLKERQIGRLIREHKQSSRDCIMLVSGKRKQESARRARNTVEHEKDGGKLWVSPIMNWSKDDVLDYKQLHDIPNNIVVDLIHRSGECNCGAYAQPGELEEIEQWFPETGCWLRDLERQVRARGFSWGWNESPPEWWNVIPDMTPEKWMTYTRREQLMLLRGQSNMWDAFQDIGNFPLCSSCDYRWEHIIKSKEEDQ